MRITRLAPLQFADDCTLIKLSSKKLHK